MSAYRYINVEIDQGQSTLTLAKPPVNVLDIAMMEEMRTALDALAADTGVRLLMITGGEAKAFSAGVEVADHTPDKVDRMLEVFHGLIRAIEAFPVPTLAAVNGAALGGGLELALCCDLRVASSCGCCQDCAREVFDSACAAVPAAPRPIATEAG